MIREDGYVSPICLRCGDRSPVMATSGDARRYAKAHARSHEGGKEPVLYDVPARVWPPRNPLRWLAAQL